MAIIHYNSQDEMDDAFEDLMELAEDHARMKESIDEAEQELEYAKEEVSNKESDLKHAQEALEEFEKEHADELFS